MRPTRRQFVGSASFAAAGATLLSSRASAQDKQRAQAEGSKPPFALGAMETPLSFLAGQKTRMLGLEMMARGFEGLPPRVSLKAGMSPVKDQHTGLFCTTFCVAACLEYHFAGSDASESNITDMAEKRFGDCQPGLGLGQAMEVATNPGACTEKAWPYDETKTCWPNPPSCPPTYRFSSYGMVFRRPSLSDLRSLGAIELSAALTIPGNFVNLLKTVLANAGIPAGVSVPVYWGGSWNGGPDVVMPGAGETYAAGHCISVCGYDDAYSRFEFKNSWGIFWGTRGYGTISYDYITNLALDSFAGFK